MEVKDIAIRATEEYKQTEVGLIPSDWKTLPIEELFTFLGGSQPPRNTFIFQEKKGYVRLLQIRDYKTDKYASYIPEHLAKRSCNIDDIMIGRYGPPIFQILNGLDGAYNVALIKATPTSKIVTKYGWFVLKQQKLFDFVDKLSQRSSGQTGVDLNELKKYLIPLPPTKAEQTAIATVLSDTDSLISRLETLIEKKRAIKQGAMQQLLKPKEGWVVKRLGEVAKFYKGKGLSKSQLSDFGTYKCIHYGELFTKYKESIKEIYSYTNANTHSFLSVPNDVLMPTSDVTPNGLATASCLNEGNVILGGDILVIRISQNTINGIFLSYYIAQNREQVMKLISGSTVYHLYGSDMARFEVEFPPVSQQIRIAQILSNMDAEIAGLEQKLAKYKLVKQGMMQELLTGKTRLV